MDSLKFNIKKEISTVINFENKYLYMYKLKNEIKNEIKNELNNIEYELLDTDEIYLNELDIDNIKREIVSEIKYEMFIERLCVYDEERNMEWSKCKNTENLFDCDYKFIRQCYNNLSKSKDEEILEFIVKNNYIGYIFHPKQLRNLFKDDIKIYMDKNFKIYINYLNYYYSNVKSFIKRIENYSFNKFKDLTIREYKNNNLTDNKLLILVYIGNIKIGVKLLEKIYNYSMKNSKFSLCFCINYKLLDIFLPYLYKYIKNSYIIYSINEFGNDITPSLLAYNEVIKNYNFEYIIKLHTKSQINILNPATNYLMNEELDKLLLKANMNSSTIGYTYININSDLYNRKLMHKFNNIIEKTEFVPSTIFLTSKQTFDKVLSFLKNNYKDIFLQNMYDDNSLNRDYSYVHFLERLFGYI